MFLRLYCTCFMLSKRTAYVGEKAELLLVSHLGNRFLLKSIVAGLRPQACTVPRSKSPFCPLTSPEQCQAHTQRQLRGCSTLEAKWKTWLPFFQTSFWAWVMCLHPLFMQGLFVSPSLCRDHRALAGKDGCCWGFDWLLTAGFIFITHLAR